VKLIAILGIVVNVVLAVIALVYTIETRKLRQQNQSQLDLLRKQARRAIAPYLLGAVTRVALPKVGFICLVENLTENLAVNVFVITFDHVSRQFRSSKGGREFVKGSTIEEFQMSEACSPPDLVDKLRETYEETNESIVRHIMADKDTSAVLVVYSDIEGNPYITRREFDINENEEVGHFGSSTIAL
jgi:hypothetical protein